MTAYERTGWRDEEISARHRVWGFNCPAVDLDFLMVEYNHGKPAAIVEYKRYTAQPVSLAHPTYRAIQALADGYQPPLPFLIARYWPGEWWFMVTPVNDAAKAIYRSDPSCRLSEQRFVRSLYYIRKHTLTALEEQNLATLGVAMPPVEAA